VGDVAIVHDYVVGRGGSERVLVSMARAFPGAPIHTAFFRPEETFPELSSADVRPFAIDRVRLLRENHRAALPVLPFAFSRATIDAAVVVCGTSGWSAGVRTTGRKVLYVHAPARWLNDQDDFLAGRRRIERAGLRLVEAPLRRWDRRAFTSGDRHLVPSRAMAATVRDLYGIDAEVLPPPVAIDAGGEQREPRPGLGAGFVLCAARLVVNKNIDVILDAFRRRPGDRLVVAGDGPERHRLEAAAPANATFLGNVSDEGMRWLLAAARAVVSASNESFGLTTVEAAMFGTPAAALRCGGSLDTVVDGVTGVLFDTVDPAAVGDALDRLDALAPDPGRLRHHAAQWSEERFVERLRDVVASEA
jgi:glycosyltransferase involved in cell wall biosynthesis